MSAKSSGKGSGKNGSTSQNAQTAGLIQRIRCCRGLERFVEKDLRDMEWPKMEKIFVQLFLRIGEKTLRECSEEREDQKKSMAAAEKRRTEDAYQSIFLRLVVKKMVEELKYRSEVTAPDLVHSRKEYYAAIEFLLDRDNRADDEDAPRGDGEGADGRPSRHAVGRSTVGNARLLGSGDGHRPLLRGAGEVVEKMGGKGGGHTSRSDGRITIEPEEEEEAFELSAGQAAQRQVRYMQEEMQRLKKENRVMRNEKLDVESIYQQLVSEQKHEKFEQRRLNVLKAQNLQLERQLALMSRALQSRKDAVGEASATLTDLAARLQARDEEGELVPVELDPGASASMLESIRVAQGKLEAVQRTALSEPTSLQRKLYYSRGNGAETPRRRVRGTPPSQKRRANGVSGGGAATADPPRQSFVNGSHTNLSVPEAISVAVADEDDAVVRHLDLEALATLEQSLGTLAPKLIALRQGLMTVTLPHMLSPVEDRVAALARECCTEVHGTAYDLSTLRCLLPTAPPSTPSLVAQAYIPPLPTKLHQGDGLGGYGDAIGDAVGQAMAPMLSVDELVSQLPPWKREQAAAGRTALHALLEYVGAREQWLKVTLDSMGAEQSYYSTCHSVQQEYVQRLCEEVEQRQASAHDDGATLHDIIKSFDAFETNTSEGTLRTFLKVFKHHHSKLGALSTRLSKRSLSQTLMRDLDELQCSFKERYSRLLEKRLRTEREAALLEQNARGGAGAAVRPPVLDGAGGGGAAAAERVGTPQSAAPTPAPPTDSRGPNGRGRSSGSEDGAM